MNEIEYVNTHGFNKTQLLADISGFYQAFGMQVMPGERVDFVGVESFFAMRSAAFVAVTITFCPLC